MTTASTIRSRLASVFLEWLDGVGRLAPDADLCLVRNVPGLDAAELPREIVISGNRCWKLAEADGDLALRLELMRANGTPLLAFCTSSEDAFQVDLCERAVLRRVVRPLARHMLSALAAGRDAAGLDDERFFKPLCDLLASPRRERLLEAIRDRSWGSTVRDADAAAVLCEAAFSFDDRYSEKAPGNLWQRWLIEQPLATPELLALARGILERRYPLYAALFDRFGTDLRAAFVDVARHDYHDEKRGFFDLALGAGKALLSSNPELLREVLQPAEAAYVAARSPSLHDDRPLLLATAYEVRFTEFVRACEVSEHAEPPTMAKVAKLQESVYADPQSIEALDRLARLSRGIIALRDRSLPHDLLSFSKLWRTELAWLDRAARRLRDASCTAQVASVARSLIDAWYGLRDAWNEAFARRLVVEWPSLFNAPGDGKPLVVSQLLKQTVRPVLKNRKTFLVVLDGCDVPTFLEIAQAFETAGVVCADFDCALSLIPTVTNHARRAIFGGEVPHDGIIADEEDGANASGDRKAFEGSNPFLDGIERQLFLKGDLSDGGDALMALLRQASSPPHLIAVVFNEIDDALSSKERGVLPERTFERCSALLRNAVIEAYTNDWRIVVTADHGHTPYRERDIVVPGLDHARFTELDASAVAPLDSIVFERGVGMPYRIAALYRLGAHAGGQHLGYHGGASLEEMFVPLAIYDRKSDKEPTRLQEPAWWDDIARTLPLPKLNNTAKVFHAETRAIIKDDSLAPYRAAIKGDARNLAIIEHLAITGALDAAQLAQSVGSKPGLMRLRVTGLVDKLTDAGLASPIAVEEDPLVFRWVGPRC